MFTITIIIIGILTFLFRGWVKAEIETVHNRLNSEVASARKAASDAVYEVKNVASNAKGIASNALSSAQRAEDKVVKHVASVTAQVSEVINSVKTEVKA